MWPDPHEVLPPGVGAALLSAYPQIAAEALQATNAELDLAAQGDAYPGIAGKQQWTKLALYQASTGWDETLCASVPTICDTLRGTLRTEREPGTHSFRSPTFFRSERPLTNECVDSLRRAVVVSERPLSQGRRGCDPLPGCSGRDGTPP